MSKLGRYALIASLAMLLAGCVVREQPAPVDMANPQQPQQPVEPQPPVPLSLIHI